LSVAKLFDLGLAYWRLALAVGPPEPVELLPDGWMPYRRTSMFANSDGKKIGLGVQDERRTAKFGDFCAAQPPSCRPGF
jgi:hypothetical protein